MKADEREKSRRNVFEKLTLSVLILFVCVAVYLFTETGYGNTEDAAAREGSGEETAETEAPAAGMARFENAILELGYVREDEDSYSFDRGGDLGTAHLTLHEENGFVYAFTLLAPMSAPADAPKEDASELEKRLCAIRQEFYAAELEWVCAHNSDLLSALDYSNRLSAPDVEDMLYYVRESAETGVRKEKAIGGIRLRAHAQGEGEARMLSVSAQQEDAYFE